MRQEYRRISVGFAGDPPPAFRVPGIDHMETVGRQMHLLVSANADAIVEEVAGEEA